MPVCGVAMRNEAMAPFDAFSFLSPMAVGMTPHEHSGRGMPNNAGPLGIAIDHLYQDGELTTGLQHTAHLLQTSGQVGPEIHRLYGRHEVELPVLVGQHLGRALTDEHLLVEHLGVHLPGFRHALLRDVDAIDLRSFDLRSILLTLGKAQTSLALPSLLALQ